MTENDMSAAAEGVEGLRESIAAIIDPNAAHARPEIVLKIERKATGERLWQIALAKADTILALAAQHRQQAVVEMREALIDLVALYDDDEGCRDLPQVIAAGAALARSQDNEGGIA